MNLDSKPASKTIMVIDDNKIDQHVTSFLIQKNKVGEKVLPYSSALEALDFLKENQNNPDLLPQVILTDIHMPLMTGFQFLEEYEKLPVVVKENCHIFIISSSCDQSDINRVKSNRNLKVSFQEKPITKEFLEKIKSLFEGGPKAEL